MKSRQITALCLMDKSFVKYFPHSKKLINETMEYCNKKLPKEFSIKYKIKKINIPKLKPRWESYLNYIKKYKKEEITILFVNKGFFKIGRPPGLGVTYKNKIIISTTFPIKIYPIHEFLLKKGTLHEIGHTLELRDSLFKRFSIMDYGFLLFNSKFTKWQKKQMQKSLDPKKKIQCTMKSWKVDFPFYSPKP